MEHLTLILNLGLWPLCLAMIGLILLQGGAGDISSAFGGGGMLDSTLGVGASKKMAKVTGWLAAVFFVVIVFLAIPHKGSLVAPAPAPAAAPAANGVAAVPAAVPAAAPAQAVAAPAQAVAAPAPAPAPAAAVPVAPDAPAAPVPAR